MIAIYLILILFIILVFMVIKIALWQPAIKLLIKKSINTSLLVLPAFISVISQSIIIYITTYLLNQFNINIINVIYERFLRFDYSNKNIFIIIFTYFISVVIIICVQALILSLAFKFNINKDLNKENLEKENNIENEPIEFKKEYTYINRICTGMFEFSILLLFLLIFSILGFILGPRLFL